MSKVTSYPPGTFCWVDLVTDDQEKAKAFYSGLFGWEAEDKPVKDVGYYSLMRHGGQVVAAIAPMPPMMKGGHSTWNSYVSVHDIAATTAKAKELGAKILSEPAKIGKTGIMASIAGPEGEAFMLWEAGEHIGARVVNEPGAWLWNELLTHDAKQAADFYTNLFGWTHNVTKMPDGRDYHMFENNGRGVGAMLEMPEMPPTWTVYFAVADVDAAVAKVEKLGGAKDMGPTTIPGTGEFAMVHDTEEAIFYVMKMEQEPTPLG
jgi:uncharacterized protein